MNLSILQIFKGKKKFSIHSQGRSMLPILLPEDKLYFKRIKYSQILTDDLILVKKGKSAITHRVIYKKKNYVITKGDKNHYSDGKIYPVQILGKVYRIKRHNKLFIPEDIYLERSSKYLHEILKIKRAFEKENINLVFLKGLPLHLYIEGSHPRRIYADCDILVNYKELKNIDKILTHHGYKKYDPSYSKLHQLLKNKPTEIQYTKITNGFSVIFDVHFEVNFLMNQLGMMNELYSQNLINDFTKECIKTSKSIWINKEKFIIPNPNFLIVYLALHFFHHNFCGAFRLEFLDKVIRKRSITNYQLPITNLIHKYKLNNFIYPVFLLLKKYYSTPLRTKFLDSIKPKEGKIKYIKSNILNINIFDDETRIAAGIARFKNLFFLSLNPLWRRTMIVFNIQVIYSVFWVMIFFLRRSVSRVLISFLAVISSIPNLLTKADNS